MRADAIAPRAVYAVVACSTLLLSAERADAQTCIGMPLDDGSVVMELHYSRVWVNSGRGGSLSAELPGAWTGQASYTHGGRERHSIGARVARELPGLSFSACPVVGAEYISSPNGRGVTIPLGVGLSSRRMADLESNWFLFALPHIQHTRFQATSGDPGSGAASNSTVLASEFGLRFVGESFHGGASATLAAGERGSPFYTVVAGLRTGEAGRGRRVFSGDVIRDRYGFTAGVIWADAGNNPDNQCGAGPGVSLGAEARTSGVWLMGAGVDLLANLAAACETKLITRTFNGQQVEVRSRPWLFGPRLRVNVGRAFVHDAFIIEPSAGAGLIYVRTDGPRDADGSFLSQWFGAGVTLRTHTAGRALHMEYGMRQVPFGYYSDNRQVHEFSEREPLLRLVVEF